MKKLIALLSVVLWGITSVAQEFANSPFYFNHEFEVYKNQYFTDLKVPSELFKDTSGKFSIQPVFYSFSAFDAKNKFFITNTKAGADFKFFSKRKNLRVSLTPMIGLYNNPVFENFIVEKNIIPHEGFFFYKSVLGYNYADFRGYVKYSPTDFITFETGRGKVFIGDGYRSLEISDFSSAYPYFRGTVNVWRIRYVYQISRLRDTNQLIGNQFYEKYQFTHLLNFNFWDIINLNLFETVISGAYDEKGLHRGLELAYLNPVIFFRSLDLMLGSPDNVIMGLGGNIKLFKSSLFYGYAFIDEFLFSHIVSKQGYWDNKFGIQAGFKTFNTLKIKGLFTQAEINVIRPYTYSHSGTYLAYGNAFQPLAHPSGANLIEKVLVSHYHFKQNFAGIKIVLLKTGLDDSLNYGKDIYKPYLTHFRETGNYITQGVPASLNYFEIFFGTRFKNLFLKASVIKRNVKSSPSTENLLIAFAVGYNFWQKEYLDWL